MNDHDHPLAPRVRAILVEHLGVPGDDVGLAYAGVDSVSLVEMLLVLEQDLGVRLDQRQLAQVRTVGDLVRACGERRAGGSARTDLTDPPARAAARASGGP